MPRFDGRGPWWGFGPGTGWGMNPCGRGYGYYYPPTSKEEEILEDEVKILEEDLKAIKTRLSELKGQK